MDPDGSTWLSADALLARGLRARDDADPRLALQHFAAALKRDPGQVKAALEAAKLLQHAGRLDEAEAVLQAIFARAPANPWIAFQCGKLARARGDHVQALDYFHASLAADPDNLWAGLDAAQELVTLGRAVEAEAVLARWPDEAHVLTRRGQLAQMRQDDAAALAHFLAAVAADPAHLKASLETAQALQRAGRLEEAEAVLQAISAHVPGNAWVAFQFGRLARARGADAQALACFQAALSADPDHCAAGLEAANTHAALGETAAELALLHRLRARHPSDIAVERRLAQATAAADARDLRAGLETAQALAEDDRADDAAALLEGLLARSPGNLRVLVRLGQLARRRGAREAALSYLQAATQADPNDLWAAIETAETLAEQGALTAARAVLQQAERTHPRDATVKLRLGRLALREGDHAAALALFRAAMEADPGHSWAALELAQHLTACGREGEAEAVLRDGLARHPAHPVLLQRLAVLARRAGRRDEALAHMLAAVAAAPLDIAALSGLAREYREQGAFGDAATIAARLLEIAPDSPRGHIEHGQIARAQGDRMAALAAFRAASALRPHQTQILVDIATEQRALGRPDAAEAVLREVLRLEPHHVPATLQIGDLQLMGERHAACVETCRAALAVHPTVTWLHFLEARALVGAAGPQAALDKLADAARLIGEQPEFLALRFDLLRQIGRPDLIREMLPACEAVARGNTNLWAQLLRFRLSIGAFDEVRAALAARIPADMQERAQLEGLRGGLAEAEWRIADAVGHYRAASRLDPGSAFMAHELARALMLDFAVDDAMAALATHVRLETAARHLRGVSLNVSQTHLGQILDEYRLDPAASAMFRGLSGIAAADRIAWLRALVRAHPDHTPVAIALMLALRQSGLLELGARSRPAGSTGPRVPRRIAQYWMQQAVPEDLRSLMQTWRDQNPDHEWQLFDDVSARTFLRERSQPAVLQAYRAARLPAQRADLFRLAWLHAEGGVYADADDRCHAPLQAVVPEGMAFVAYQEEFATLGNNFLACIPGHPVIGRALVLASEALLRGDTDLLWLSTGPGLVTRAFALELADASADAPGWLAGIAVLERWQLAAAVTCHCRVGYKQTDDHWARSEFARRKARPPGHVAA